MAIDRFLAKPFHEVSVSEIATAAHCSLSAIYDMFGDKEGLYMEALAAQKKTLRAPRSKATTAPILSSTVDQAAAPIPPRRSTS